MSVFSNSATSTPNEIREYVAAVLDLLGDQASDCSTLVRRRAGSRKRYAAPLPRFSEPPRPLGSGRSLRCSSISRIPSSSGPGGCG